MVDAPRISFDVPLDGERSKARVLFVDDEPAILTTMRIMFRRKYEVLTAGGGEEALDLLRREDVDVIVSDQRMPGMLGAEVLRNAREIRPRAMRILLTGYSDLTAIVGSINEGEVYRFCQKPWSNDEFAHVVAEAVEAAEDIPVEAAARLVEKGDEPVRFTRPAVAPAAAPGAPAPLEAPVADERPGILVLDSDDVAVSELQRMLEADYRVHHATTIAAGLDLLEKHSVGVVVTEALVGNEEVTTVLSLLKQHHPQVVSVVLTHRSDANVAIDLINQGQIFRFLLKPVRAGMTKRSINQAMERHRNLIGSPNLLKRYRVKEAPAVAAARAGSSNAAVAPAAVAGAAGLLSRIRNLRTSLAARPA